jgi:hypothetical protein
VDASRVTNEVYPDSSNTDSTGFDQVRIEYNVDGSVFKRYGQGTSGANSTIIEFTYKGRRQNELQKATQLLARVDNHVQSIKRQYDTLGRIEFITSYSGSDGTGTIRNEVRYAYNSAIAKLSQVWQSHEGAAVTSGISPSPLTARTAPYY